MRHITDPAPDDAPPPSRDAGFVLILVIVLAAALAVFGVTFATLARTHVRTASNAVTATQTALLADGGITLGMSRLVTRAERDLPLEAFEHVCRFPEGHRLLLTASDEGGRVDLNLAGRPLLTALFVASGQTTTAAEALAEGILVTRGSIDTKAATAPRGAPFTSLADVRAVDGLTGDLFDRIAPFATVYSGLQGIDPRAAPAGFVQALARTDVATRGHGDTLPGVFTAASTGNAWRLRAVVLDGDAAATREAIVSIRTARSTSAPRPDPGFGVDARPRSKTPPRLTAAAHEWRQSHVTDAERSQLAREQALPPC